MLTAYDALTAAMLEECGVDFILVGDSLGMVLLGYPSTAEVTMEDMLHHAKAARRGTKKAFLVGDLPLKGVEKSPRQALESSRRFVKEAGCDAVKLEWGPRAEASTRLIARSGIPVMGHIGLTPQTAKTYRLRGAQAKDALNIYRHAKAFEAAGAFAVLLECVPAELSAAVTHALGIPTFGIGAGSACDGQVLVFQDAVGLFTKFAPRFVKRYAHLDRVARSAVTRYVSDIHTGRFPSKKHSFFMKPSQWRAFRSALKKEGTSNGR